jgi:hypothetical protein
MSNIVKIEPGSWDGKSIIELKKLAKEYYTRRFKGKKVLNKHLGITILFTSKGINHLLYSRSLGFEKLVAVKKLNHIVEFAKFSNFKSPDLRDAKEVLGYYNFTCKIVIHNKGYVFRIAVRITKDGKFYYDHAVRTKK